MAFEVEIIGDNGNEIIRNFIHSIHKDTQSWHCEGLNMPWYRGQGDCSKPPIPVVFRKKHNGQDGYFNEFWLSTTFRNKAPNFGDTPNDRDDIDKWLFLMRHMELPTRLLDWSESALISLFMASCEYDKIDNPAVWMLNPVALNHVALGVNSKLEAARLKEYNDLFSNTWVQGKPALENIRLAFKHPAESGANYAATELPLAIQLTYCHSRMSAQKGCFTVYGRDERNFEELFGPEHPIVEKGFFKKYVFCGKKKYEIYNELQKLGITHSSVFPDMIGLSKELSDRFFYSEDKPEFAISKLSTHTAEITATTYYELNRKYQTFLSIKMKENNFFRIDSMNFWKGNKFRYYISYTESANEQS